MPRVKIIIRAGELIVDFDGFRGNACRVEEEKMRLLLARLGADSEPGERRAEEEPNANGHAEREKVGA